MADGTTNLFLLGGGGLLAYRAYYGKWPWEGKLFQKKKKPPARPPARKLSVTGISFSSAEVNPGESFTVDANVENTGEEKASGTVVFTVGGGEVASQDVTLAGGKSTTVTSTVKISESGTHEICAKVA